MKNLLIAVYDYDPAPSANTICLKHIIEKISTECEIHIVCVKPIEECNEYENLGNIHIHRIKMLEDTVGRKTRLSNSGGHEGIKAIVSAYFKYTSVYGYTGYTRCYQSRYMQNKIEHIINSFQIDTLLSISYPFSTQVVCSRIKKSHPELKWIAYELDPFTFNFTLPYEQIEKRKAIETEVFRYADAIISTIGIDEYNEKMRFRSVYRDKTLSIGLPGLSVRKIDETKSIIRVDENKVNLIYTGQFYGALRSPEPLIKLLFGCVLAKDIVLHIIGGSISNYYRKEVDEFSYIEYSRTTPSVCDASTAMSDVAVNLDNKIPNQAPSKILNYMAINMPIINMYYKGCEVGDWYLLGYDNHLSICIDDVDTLEAKSKFTEFVMQCKNSLNKGKYAGIRNEISNDYVCNKICEVIIKGCVTT